MEVNGKLQGWGHKAKFIKAHPHLSGEEIEAAAAKKGSFISQAYITKIRSDMKHANTVTKVSKGIELSKNQQLARLILEIGVDEAENIFKQVRERLEAIQ